VVEEQRVVEVDVTMVIQAVSQVVVEVVKHCVLVDEHTQVDVEV
jgi:hypothetical protein